MAACLLSLSLYRRGAGLIAVALLLLLGQSAHASEHGNYCVQDYMPGAVCTANDVRIIEFQVTETIEACGAVTPGVAKVRLNAFVSSAGAPDRYDIGLFMGTDGGSALSGDSCLHDHFGGGVSATPTYGDFNGDGVDDLHSAPWQTNDEDAEDVCGDIRADSQLFKDEDVVMIPCRDSDDDGVVDVSACASWDNNKSNGSDNAPHCKDVKGAFPGTSSKCGCDEVVAVVGLPAGAIQLTKLPATQTIDVGGTAQFTLTATNPTSIELTNVVLDDPRCTTLDPVQGDLNRNGVMESTETWTWRCFTENVLENFTNVGTVTALARGQEVTDQASADVIVQSVSPPGAGAIELVKLPATQTIDQGTSAHFTLTATNPTSVDLTNVVLDDPRCTTLSAPSGDTNGNAVLESTETWTWGCITADVQQDFTNVGTVTALANGQTVFDRATADVVVRRVSPPAGSSSIDIEKILVSMTPDPATGRWTVVIRLEVANTGTFDLTDVTVTDALSATSGGNFGTWTNTMPTLAGTYTVSDILAQGLQPNMAFTGDAGNTTVASGTLAAGTTAWAQFTITIMPQASGTFVNQSRVTAIAPDGPVEDDDDIGMTVGEGQVGPAPIPVDANWALLLLALGALALGMRRLHAAG